MATGRLAERRACVRSCIEHFDRCRRHEGRFLARVFVTGSADGLGLMAARKLVGDGHSVVLHARDRTRAQAAQDALPAAETVLLGDVSTLPAMRDVAEQANELGQFDAVIHNVGIGYREPQRIETADGLSGSAAQLVGDGAAANRQTRSAQEIGRHAENGRRFNATGWRD